VGTGARETDPPDLGRGLSSGTLGLEMVWAENTPLFSSSRGRYPLIAPPTSLRRAESCVLVVERQLPRKGGIGEEAVKRSKGAFRGYVTILVEKNDQNRSIKNKEGKTVATI